MAKFKIKTKKAAAKRFKIKPSGKIKHDRANHEHKSTEKSKSRKNRLKKASYIGISDLNRVKRCLPNG